ncbi:MAG TPA: gliding motility-associated C-terminal domain-containing protein, partial [Saprospiraceae bacterium]|nr:gliding motility-associated C-terminal domain-containing protein [Saprospiraceae bacterium]
TPIIRDDEITLIAVDPYGCELNTNRTMDVLMNYGVYIPNVFSPNGDGINDKFTLYANKKGEELVLFQIYDRWGNMVYEATHKDVQAFQSDGWDGFYKGKLMDNGVYVYQAIVKFIDGDVREFSGDVTLVR